MTNKYNQKLIWKYINGEEIPNVDKLENDYMFMMQVIRATRDKKMYNLCSKEIKENYQFTKFILETFKSDKKFITEIASNYLNTFDEEDIESKEIIFLMCELLNENSNDFETESILFYLKRNIIYSAEKMLIDATLQEEDELTKQELGLGFAYIIYDELGESEIITKYFAEQYLNQIFYNNEYTLEELIHKHFLRFNDLKEIGIKQYILNYISYFDKYLAEYLNNHLDLIEKLEKSIINVGLNWQNYLIREFRIKREKFETEANKIIEKYNVNFNFDEVCYHIDKMNLNLQVELSEYKYYDENIKDYIDYTHEIETTIDNNNFINYKCIQEIIKLVKKIYITEPKELILDKRLFNCYPINDKKVKKTKILNYRKRNRIKEINLTN